MARSVPKLFLGLFASRKTAVFLLIAAITGSLVKAETGWGGNYPLIAVLVLLSVNLIVCLPTNYKKIWERSRSMFIFHIALIGLVLSSLVSVFTFAGGYFQLAEGQTWEGELPDLAQGPLYRDRLEGFSLTSLRSKVVFHDRDMGVKTDQQLIGVMRPGKPPETKTIRFNAPILYGAYRFYLAPERGYALVFRFTDDRGAARSGAVFLPDYPATRERQISPFVIPGASSSRQLTVKADLSSGPYTTRRPWSLEIPTRQQIELAYIADGKRRRTELAPGESIKIAGGTLMFLEMRTWHGYLLHYDPTRPFLAFFSVVCIASLSWFYVPTLLRRQRNPQAAGKSGKSGEEFANLGDDGKASASALRSHRRPPAGGPQGQGESLQKKAL